MFEHLYYLLHNNKGGQRSSDLCHLFVPITRAKMGLYVTATELTSQWKPTVKEGLPASSHPDRRRQLGATQPAKKAWALGNGSWCNIIHSSFVFICFQHKNVLTVWFHLLWGTIVCSAKKEPLCLLCCGFVQQRLRGPPELGRPFAVAIQTEASGCCLLRGEERARGGKAGKGVP